MQFKPVMIYEPSRKLFRVGRFLWGRGSVGDGIGWTAKLSIAFWPRVIAFRREFFGWSVTVAGLRFHYSRSYGGRIV